MRKVPFGAFGGSLALDGGERVLRRTQGIAADEAGGMPGGEVFEALPQQQTEL